MTKVTYTQYGPWTDGGSPGVAAEFLNPLETFLVAGWFDSAITSDGSGNLSAVSFIATTTGTVLNGGSAGTATLWQDCRGSIKRVFIYANGFKTGASNQTIALPVAFTKGGFIRTGFINKVQLLSSGGEITINISTAFNATSIGTTSGEPTMWGYGIGEVRDGFDTVQFPSGDASACTGFIEIVGN